MAAQYKAIWTVNTLNNRYVRIRNILDIHQLYAATTCKSEHTNKQFDAKMGVGQARIMRADHTGGVSSDDGRAPCLQFAHIVFALNFGASVGAFRNTYRRIFIHHCVACVK